MIVALGVFTLRGGDEKGQSFEIYIDWNKVHYTFSNFNKDRRQIFEVMDYQIHPNFRTETTTRNDIALLERETFLRPSRTSASYKLI